MASPLYQTEIIAGPFTALVPVKYACQFCDAEFTPKRTTARFCSAKCRVYWNRRQRK